LLSAVRVSFLAYPGIDGRPCQCEHKQTVNFVDATDRLTKCPTHEDIAAAAEWSSVQTVRQARLDPSSSSYRRPPDGWEAAIAKLARQRAKELERLARELER
jgi:hypothetical protein